MNEEWESEKSECPNCGEMVYSHEVWTSILDGSLTCDHCEE